MSEGKVAERPSVGATLLRKKPKQPKLRDFGKRPSVQHRAVIDLVKTTFRYLNNTHLAEAQTYDEVVDVLVAMRDDYAGSTYRDDRKIGDDIDRFMIKYQMR